MAVAGVWYACIFVARMHFCSTDAFLQYGCIAIEYGCLFVIRIAIVRVKGCLARSSL